VTRHNHLVCHRSRLAAGRCCRRAGGPVSGCRYTFRPDHWNSDCLNGPSGCHGSWRGNRLARFCHASPAIASQRVDCQSHPRRTVGRLASRQRDDSRPAGLLDRLSDFPLFRCWVDHSVHLAVESRTRLRAASLDLSCLYQREQLPVFYRRSDQSMVAGRSRFCDPCARRGVGGGSESGTLAAGHSMIYQSE
jgi:hypothetical protein